MKLPIPGTKMTICGPSIPEGERELEVKEVIFDGFTRQVTITFDAYVPKTAIPQIRFDAAVGILRKLLSHPQEEDREALAVKHATSVASSNGGQLYPSEAVFEHAARKLLALNLCPACGSVGFIRKLKEIKRPKRKQFCPACGWSEKGWIFI